MVNTKITEELELKASTDSVTPDIKGGKARNDLYDKEAINNSESPSDKIKEEINFSGTSFWKRQNN